ncbi:hypothetical protein KSP40_PGU012150 [Platanthera guangdongensis]|uniref:Uncharacterized protein n=1 Tax=Platanthera guangdongensis TaxID=2320717 RepID=A0ABR2LX28_9ASPA
MAPGERVACGEEAVIEERGNGDYAWEEQIKQPIRRVPNLETANRVPRAGGRVDGSSRTVLVIQRVEGERQKIREKEIKRV